MQMQQSRQGISIKGIREGILISLGPGAFSQLLQELSSELLSRDGFLDGSRVTLSVGQQAVEPGQLLKIQELLADHQMELWTVLAEKESSKEAARKLGLATRLPGSKVDLDGNALPEVEIDLGEPPGGRTEKTEGSNSLLLRETLRSGRSVFHEGHVVVIGDVNPGAEIMAGGDVIVWGKLRGMVHAGAMGDSSAVICALQLNPTQLRIAGQIAIPPAGKQQKPAPEQAAIQDGQIVAVPWKP